MVPEIPVLENNSNNNQNINDKNNFAGMEGN